ncbi:MAG: hypothetical protein ACPGXY_00155 [Alphaproteobacteria bacterium]
MVLALVVINNPCCSEFIHFVKTPLSFNEQVIKGPVSAKKLQYIASTYHPANVDEAFIERHLASGNIVKTTVASCRDYLKIKDRYYWAGINGYEQDKWQRFISTCEVVEAVRNSIPLKYKDTRKKQYFLDALLESPINWIPDPSGWLTDSFPEVSPNTLLKELVADGRVGFDRIDTGIAKISFQGTEIVMREIVTAIFDDSPVPQTLFLLHVYSTEGSAAFTWLMNFEIDPRSGKLIPTTAAQRSQMKQ